MANDLIEVNRGAILMTTVAMLSLLALANAGDFQAGTEAYKRGDFEAALREWRSLAEQGVAVAQYNLGIMYEYGRGMPQNDVEAAKWYRMAAELGHAGAQINLGGMYFAGRGVPQNHAEAAKWSHKAAEQGAADAQYNLGVMYFAGRGVPQNDAEAVKWLRKAGRAGSRRCAIQPGCHVSRGQGRATERHTSLRLVQHRRRPGLDTGCGGKGPRCATDDL